MHALASHGKSLFKIIINKALDPTLGSTLAMSSLAISLFIA
jgi:hypothetical protein